MIDAVLSYHGNPLTSGVGKFNLRLATLLRVPHAMIGTSAAVQSVAPLISCKASEVPDESLRWFSLWPSHSLFLHEWGNTARERAWLGQAATVYAANEEIATACRILRADVIEAWCPATVSGDASRPGLRVLAFGMAHKLNLKRHCRLADLLNATRQPYTVSLSTAVHEGSPWHEVAEVGAVLREVYGGHLRCLGYLLDDALVAELAVCDVVALFYQPALRANHTTFWAAYDAGKPIVTNLDVYSPRMSPWGVWSLDDLAVWPTLPHQATIHRVNKQTWEGLLSLMGVGVHERDNNRLRDSGAV